MSIKEKRNTFAVDNGSYVESFTMENYFRAPRLGAVAQMKKAVL